MYVATPCRNCSASLTEAANAISNIGSAFGDSGIFLNHCLLWASKSNTNAPCPSASAGYKCSRFALSNRSSSTIAFLRIS